MKQVLVSLCIPTYRRAKHLEQTLRSVLAQTIADLEVLIVDDASPDNTPEIVSRFKDPRIRYTRNEKNLGVPYNYNYAFSLARGEYVALIEDHDILDRRYLEELLVYLKEYPKVAFAASGIITIDEEGRPLQRFVENLPPIMSGHRLLRLLLKRTTCPFTITTLIRRDSLHDIKPPFNAKYWWYADINLWMQLCTRGDFVYVQKPLLRARIRESGHPLTNRGWESIFCLERIHADNWTLLHSTKTLLSEYDRACYEIAKLYDVFRYRAWRSLDGTTPWSMKDEQNTRRYLPRIFHPLLPMVDLMPSSVASTLQFVFRVLHASRRKI